MREPVLGYRRWAVTFEGRGLAPRLRGRVAPAVWQAGDWTEALCDHSMAKEQRAPHEAPDRGCDCGLYAYHTLRPALLRKHSPPRMLGFGWDNSEERDVIGAVIGAGRIVVHPSGWRAQYARPVVLAVAPGAPVAAIQRIAGTMGIPVVQLDDLERCAVEFGSVIRAA